MPSTPYTNHHHIKQHVSVWLGEQTRLGQEQATVVLVQEPAEGGEMFVIHAYSELSEAAAEQKHRLPLATAMQKSRASTGSGTYRKKIKTFTGKLESKCSKAQIWTAPCHIWPPFITKALLT